MDSTSIELPGSEIESIRLDGDTLHVRFSRAYLIKTMTGSVERTRWWQAGELVMEAVELQSPLPEGPLVCAGGDVVENVFTYRDMIPVPLDSRGHTRCTIKFADGQAPFAAQGRTVKLVMEKTPKYIEHLKAE